MRFYRVPANCGSPILVSKVGPMAMLGGFALSNPTVNYL